MISNSANIYSTSEDNNNQPGILERMRSNANDCIESCSALMRTESGQKLIAYVVIGTVLLGAILIFGTAFETASEFKVTNKTSSNIYPSWISPAGVKNHCSVIFPRSSCIFKFNGINDYISIQTAFNAGTMHVNNRCQTSLKNGPSNRKLSSKGIIFWTCNADYKKFSGTIFTEDLNETDKPNLRGADLSS